MRNFLIVIGTIVSGLSYGWCLVYYPDESTIIAKVLIIMAIVFWFIIMAISLKREGGDEAPQSNRYDK